MRPQVESWWVLEGVKGRCFRPSSGLIGGGEKARPQAELRSWCVVRKRVF